MSDRWQRFLTAFKVVQGAGSADSDEELAAPHGFVTRLAAGAVALRRDHLTSLWRRWSLRGAIASTCLFVIAALYASAPKDDSTSLLPVPSLQIPNP